MSQLHRHVPVRAALCAGAAIIKTTPERVKQLLMDGEEVPNR
jgi:hypothetical protein